MSANENRNRFSLRGSMPAMIAILIAILVLSGCAVGRITNDPTPTATTATATEPVVVQAIQSDTVQVSPTATSRPYAAQVAPTVQPDTNALGSPAASCTRRPMTVAEVTNLIDATASDEYADGLTVLLGRQADTQCLQDFTSPVGGWQVKGPAVILTDPGHQPLTGGTRIVKTWHFQRDWIFGVYFCPSGSTCTIPTPGRAIELDGELPVQYLH